MNILEHQIYKDIYDLCQKIEELPASEFQTKLVTMAGNLQYPAKELVDDQKRLNWILNKTKVVESFLNETIAPTREAVDTAMCEPCCDICSGQHQTKNCLA